MDVQVPCEMLQRMKQIIVVKLYIKSLVGKIRKHIKGNLLLSLMFIDLEQVVVIDDKKKYRYLGPYGIFLTNLLNNIVAKTITP